MKDDQIKIEEESNVVKDIMNSAAKLGLTEDDWEEILKERRGIKLS